MALKDCNRFRCPAEEEHLEWGVRIDQPSMRLGRVEEGTIAHRDGRLRGCFGMLVTHANDAPVGDLVQWGMQSTFPEFESGRFTERLWSRCTALKLQLRPEGAGEPSQGSWSCLRAGWKYSHVFGSGKEKDHFRIPCTSSAKCVHKR
eukprot:gene15314-biopygen5832